MASNSMLHSSIGQDGVLELKYGLDAVTEAICTWLSKDSGPVDSVNTAIITILWIIRGSICSVTSRSLGGLVLSENYAKLSYCSHLSVFEEQNGAPEGTSSL